MQLNSLRRQISPVSLRSWVRRPCGCTPRHRTTIPFRKINSLRPRTPTWSTYVKVKSSFQCSSSTCTTVQQRLDSTSSVARWRLSPNTGSKRTAWAKRDNRAECSPNHTKLELTTQNVHSHAVGRNWKRERETSAHSFWHNQSVEQVVFVSNTEKKLDTNMHLIRPTLNSISMALIPSSVINETAFGF